MTGIPFSFLNRSTHPPDILQEIPDESNFKIKAINFRKVFKILILLFPVFLLSFFILKVEFSHSLPSITNLPSSPPTPSVVYLRSAYQDFTGRSDILKLLEKALISSPSLPGNSVRVMQLWGKGGVGKSELAIEFANRHFSKFSIIWTFTCDNQEHFEKGYRILAEKLDIPHQQDGFDEVRQKVHFYLENHAFHFPWLLIFDNVEKDLIDYPQRGGAIIVTSQKRVVHPDSIIEVTSFSNEESIELLKKITHEEVSQEMKLLIEELDGIPLLLNYAAHYIKAIPGCSIAQYRKLFSSHLCERTGPLFHEMDVNQRYRKSLEASWQLPLQFLEKEHPLALQWLYISAYLYPGRIKEDWVEAWLSQKFRDQEQDTQLGKYEILKPLIDFGIIRYEETTQCFVLHRFFQCMLRESQKTFTEEYLREAIALLIEFSKDCEDEKRTPLRSWRFHASEIIKWCNHHQSDLSPSTILMLANIYKGISEWSIIYDYHYLDAVEACKKALKLLEASNQAESPTFGLLYSKLGLRLNFVGRYEEAIVFYDRALEIQSHYLSEDPIEYSKTLMRKGLTLCEQGEYGKSRECFHESLKLRMGHLDAAHPSIGRCLNCLGIPLLELKQFDQAKNLIEQALKILTNFHGGKHPLIASCFNNKAWVMYKENRFSEALDLFNQAHHINLSTGSRGYLCRDLNGIGWCYIQLKKYQEAINAFNESLSIGLACYGQNNGPVLGAYKGLGWAYIKIGQWSEGLKYLMTQLEIGGVIYHQRPKMAEILEDFKQALIEVVELGGDIDEAADFASKISECHSLCVR
jgi:tetratricopeptide (TPR) repeat protein